jgi:hypothetical protein
MIFFKVLMEQSCSAKWYVLIAQICLLDVQMDVAARANGCGSL